MKCPGCGKKTEGPYYDGSIKWALCKICAWKKFNKDYERCLKQGERYMETGNINEFKH